MKSYHHETSAPVSFSGRRPKRRSQWSWVHATACSCAIVASGAYVHSVITEFVETMPFPPPPSMATSPPPAKMTIRQSFVVLAEYIRVAVGSEKLFPRRWVLSALAVVVWVGILLLARRLRLHEPIQRVLTRIENTAHAFDGASFSSASVKQQQTKNRRVRRLFSTDFDVDEDDMLVVTSLSLRHKHAHHSRGRRSSQSHVASSSSSTTTTTMSAASPVSSSSRETVDVDEVDEVDAQILLHPHDGAKGGRHQSNNIIVDDPYVSRYHFEIGYDPLEKEYYLQDLGSTTGTFLFLKPDVPKRLHVADRVRIGDSEVEVVAIDENPVTGSPFIRISFTEGPLRGVSQTIGRTTVTLGRRSSNALCITNDASISGRHSALSFLGDGFYITDLQSTNGTAFRLSPASVKSGRRYLMHGDIFGVGANRFLVEYSHELKIQEKQRAVSGAELASSQRGSGA